MWSALDWTGMLTYGDGAPDASAPSDAPGATPVATARPVNKNKRMSSSRTVHAEAIEVIADEDRGSKKKWDDNSDTGSETDTDSDNDGAVKENGSTKKRCCMVLVCAILLAAIASGAFTKKATEKEAEGLGLGLASTNYSCSANGTVDFESADVILNLGGMERKVTESELEQVQSSISSVYNDVSAGCDDVYQRIMANATVIEQALVEDSKGSMHLTMGIRTTLACDGCAVEDEILFGGDDEDDEDDEDEEDEAVDKKGERKLRSGVRGAKSELHADIVPHGFRRGRILKGSKKDSKKSVNSQEFIDELDATLQATGIPLKHVKDGYVYKQKGGKKKNDKVKMVPKKKTKEDKKHKEDTDEIYKGDLKEDERRQRRQ